MHGFQEGIALYGVRQTVQLASIDSANNGWLHVSTGVWPWFKILTEFIFSIIQCANIFNVWTLSLDVGKIVLIPGGSEVYH